MQPETKELYIAISSGITFMGLSDGPSGTLIRLEEPLLYSEVTDKKKGTVQPAIGEPWRIPNAEAITVRFDVLSRVGVDMDAKSAAMLENMHRDASQRIRMNRSGLVAASGNPMSKADMEQIKRKIDEAAR